jgi:predicted RNase H-like nuclease (RuvC/YqgF family)
MDDSTSSQGLTPQKSLENWQKIDSLNSEKKNLETRIQELETQKKNLENEKNQLEKSLKDSIAENEELKSVHIEEMEKEFRKNYEQQFNLQNDIDNLKKKIDVK